MLQHFTESLFQWEKNVFLPQKTLVCPPYLRTLGFMNSANLALSFLICKLGAHSMDVL